MSTLWLATQNPEEGRRAPPHPPERGRGRADARRAARQRELRRSRGRPRFRGQRPQEGPRLRRVDHRTRSALRRGRRPRARRRLGPRRRRARRCAGRPQRPLRRPWTPAIRTATTSCFASCRSILARGPRASSAASWPWTAPATSASSTKGLRGRDRRQPAWRGRLRLRSGLPPARARRRTELRRAQPRRRRTRSAIADARSRPYCEHLSTRKHS